jgi:hypothetical protein|tara:strand:+ start:1192 stop:1383 length:192 start_codon:yes stop_codon:yes gene_type:complete
MQATQIDYIILFYGMVVFLLGAGLLAELSVFIAKKIGFKEPDPTDFMARLEAGEVLDKDNMFG